MASLRNLAIGILKHQGTTNIAKRYATTPATPTDPSHSSASPHPKPTFRHFAGAVVEGLARDWRFELHVVENSTGGVLVFDTRS
jgi:hypothetical protein